MENILYEIELTIPRDQIPKSDQEQLRKVRDYLENVKRKEFDDRMC